MHVARSSKERKKKTLRGNTEKLETWWEERKPAGPQVGRRLAEAPVGSEQRRRRKAEERKLALPSASAVAGRDVPLLEVLQCQGHRTPCGRVTSQVTLTSAAMRNFTLALRNSRNPIYLIKRLLF